MLISSIFSSPILLLPKSSFKPVTGQIQSAPIVPGYGRNGVLQLECSSRPQKKATAHHMKTRPKKSQPWDIRRKPTVYPPLPPLPPDWTLVSSAADDGVGDGGSATQVPVPSTSSLQEPITAADVKCEIDGAAATEVAFAATRALQASVTSGELAVCGCIICFTFILDFLVGVFPLRVIAAIAVYGK